MKLWQKILLAVVVTALVVLMIRTWGSLGSAVTMMCLITLCCGLLYQKFLTNRNSDDFDME